VLAGIACTTPLRDPGTPPQEEGLDNVTATCPDVVVSAGIVVVFLSCHSFCRSCSCLSW